MVTRWQIWYDTGRVLDSTYCSPEDAPTDGIMGIIEWHDDLQEPRRYYGQEFYQWIGDSWRAGNQADLERWLRAAMPTLKYGRWVPASTWEHIKQAMIRVCQTS